MRLLDSVPFADSLDELSAEERRQVPRIVADVLRDYLARAPASFLELAEGRAAAEAWAWACAERQALDAVNTQRYLKAKGLEALTRLQEEGRLAAALLTQELPKPPWEGVSPLTP